MTQYDSIIYMDSDTVVVRHMDDILANVGAGFLAAPRAYWLDPGELRPGCGSATWSHADGPQVGLQMKFTSALMVVQPSTLVWRRLQDKCAGDGMAGGAALQ